MNSDQGNHGLGARRWCWPRPCSRERSRRWRRPLTEPENLKHLIGPYLIGHASALPVPRNAAGPVTVTWVLPGSACVGFDSPIMPEPLAIRIGILPGLH